jgi:hypothetical protein
MINEDYDWLHNNYSLLGNVRMTQEQAKELYDVYNRITGDNKPVSSCGRCVLNIKKRLKIEYEIIHNLRNKDR